MYVNVSNILTIFLIAIISNTVTTSSPAHYCTDKCNFPHDRRISCQLPLQISGTLSTLFACQSISKQHVLSNASQVVSSSSSSGSPQSDTFGDGIR